MSYTLEQILDAADRAWQKTAGPGLCAKDGVLQVMAELRSGEAEFLERLEGHRLYNIILKINADMDLDVDLCMDQIYNLFDTGLRKGYYIAINNCLKQIECDKFEHNILVGILTITFVWKKLLPARAELFKQARQSLIKAGKDADKVLEGLG